jgi:hypothetical protein
MNFNAGGVIALLALATIFVAFFSLFTVPQTSQALHAWSKSSSTGQFNWPMAIETQRSNPMEVITPWPHMPTQDS